VIIAEWLVLGRRATPRPGENISRQNQISKLLVALARLPNPLSSDVTTSVSISVHSLLHSNTNNPPDSPPHHHLRHPPRHTPIPSPIQTHKTRTTTLHSTKLLSLPPQNRHSAQNYLKSHHTSFRPNNTVIDFQHHSLRVLFAVFTHLVKRHISYNRVDNVVRRLVGRSRRMWSISIVPLVHYTP
jgi:hypothetical protein